MPCERSKFKILVVTITINSAIFAAISSAWANPRSEALLQQALKEAMLLDTKDAAVKHIDQAISINPKNPVYWRVKAQILQGLEESEKALPCITKSLELYPHSAEAYSIKADILVRLGRTDQALTAIDQALKLMDHPNLHSVRAFIFKNQRKFDLAENELDIVIKAEPNNLIARSARAKVAAQLKHWQKAIDDLTFAMANAKKKNYSYYENLLARVEAYTATKQYDKAIADCKAGIEGQPELPQFHVALLKVFTMNGNKAGAAGEAKALSDMDVDYQSAKNFGS